MKSFSKGLSLQRILESNLALSLILLLFSPPVLAEPLPSLFFYENDIEAIDEDFANLPARQTVIPKHLLHLDSILYIGPQHWTVWLQGEKITPTEQHTMHRVFDVTPNSLRIAAKLHNGHSITKTLAPHQSLNLLTGEVVEGW